MVYLYGSSPIFTRKMRPLQNNFITFTLGSSFFVEIIEVATIAPSIRCENITQ